ncbi:protein TIFY 5A-like [Momordica charantia]|uniref:Protein TIFY 5A-like n=1 Tax=Momordica charantia TaxID=3673 RepID=A0A6J1CG02_MOMCH|nr:protein TIFY 5A-like [Momordica charantia]
MTMIFPTPPMEPQHTLHCNLELCLSPPPAPPSSATAAESTTTSTSDHHHPMVNYHHGFPVTDLTELQARAIIIGATRQMEERKTTCRTRSAEEKSSSMKRSLQRFLQKRKHRIQTLTPYTTHHF